MALSKADILAKYPLPVYNYKVDISDGSSTSTVAFSEVSGLNMPYETSTYKESKTSEPGAGPNIMYMIAQPQPVNITLKKGYVKANSINVLYAWLNTKQLNGLDKRDISVKLCDENGNPIVTWKVLNAFPTKLDAPTFDASSNDVAIESMELMADWVTLEE